MARLRDKDRLIEMLEQLIQKLQRPSIEVLTSQADFNMPVLEGNVPGDTWIRQTSSGLMTVQISLTLADRAIVDAIARNIDWSTMPGQEIMVGDPASICKYLQRASRDG